MMELAIDQAEGLRAMFRPQSLRVLTLCAAQRNVGYTQVMTNLAVGLARRGLRVVVLDAGRGLVAPALGLTARYELMQLLTGEREFSEVLLNGPEGICVLPASRGVQSLVDAKQDPADLFGAFLNLSQPFDFVLLSVPAITAAALTHREDEISFVMDASDDCIRATYAEIKQLATQYGRRYFRLVYNKMDGNEAANVHHRLAHAAHKFLDCELEFGGFIPRDLAMKNAQGGFCSVFAMNGQSAAAQSFEQLASSADFWRIGEFSNLPQ
jgi:flagellar biosynthesis protein FlhG